MNALNRSVDAKRTSEMPRSGPFMAEQCMQGVTTDSSSAVNECKVAGTGVSSIDNHDLVTDSMQTLQ